MGLLDGLGSIREAFSSIGNTPPSPDPNTTRPAENEPIGASGRAHMNGFIQWDETNPAWIGTQGLKLADQMWRTDADIKRDTLACWSPILTSSISVEPYGGDEATDKDRYAAELASYALWEFMRPNIMGHLAEVGPILIRSGFTDFEQIWQSTMYKGKKVILPKKLDLRLPRTIWKWYQDDAGDLTGIVQFLPNARNVFIPATELVHYRLQAEGDNWVGTSMYRHAYKHFYYKEKLEVIMAIGEERKAVGVPVVYPPTGATREQKEEIEVILANLHTNEVGFVVMPGPKAAAHIEPSVGWEIDVIRFDSSSGDGIRAAIDQQTLKVAGAFLADFLELGHHAVGARATAEVQEDPFLTAVKSMGALVMQPLNDLAARVAMLNVPGLEGAPKLKMSLHDEASLSELSTYGLQLYQAGMLTPDPALEDYFRARADFPLADPDVREEVEEARKAGRQAAINGEPGEEGDEPGSGGASTGDGGVKSGGGARGGLKKTERTNASKGGEDPDTASGDTSHASERDPAGANNGPKKPSAKSLMLDVAGEAPSGAMVALYPSPEVAESLAVEDGLDPEELHVTLAFLGKAEDLEDEDAIRNAVARWAADTPPIDAKTAGMGVFTPSDSSEGMPVTYASVDSPHMARHRERLVEKLKRAGVPVSEDHGFAPHVSLAYTERREIEPPNRSLTFDRATLAIGGKHEHFPLAGRRPPAQLDGLGGGAAGLQITAPIEGAEPPHYQMANTAARRCGTCSMYDSAHGTCEAYDDYPVLPDHVCDSWQAAGPPQTSHKRKTLAADDDPAGAVWYEELLSQGRLREALDGARKAMETATRPAAIKLAATTAARGRSGRRIAVASPPGDLIEAFQKEMERLYAIGYDTVKDELEKQHKALNTEPVQLDSPEQTEASEDPAVAAAVAHRRSRITRRAKIAAEHVANEVAREVERGSVAGEREPRALQRRAETAAVRAIHKEAMTNASPSINDGRRDAAIVAAVVLAARRGESDSASEGPVGDVGTGGVSAAPGTPGSQLFGIYTAVLDSRTCGYCQAADDGVEREPEDPALTVPNPECNGGEFCRCTVVWVLTGIEDAFNEV